MKRCRFWIRFLFLFFALSGLACSRSTASFTSWQVETFETTAITASQTRMVSLRNENGEALQTLLGVGFDGTGDGKQHFRIDKVLVSDRVVELKNIIIPPGSSLNIQITYEPRNLETTEADFGGRVTGGEKRFEPYKPSEESKKEEEDEAIHRAVLLAVYDLPNGGIAQIELVGKAVPGPNGEISLPEIGGGECETGGGFSCFRGNFSIDIPALFTTGPVEQELAGPIRFEIAEPEASLKMEDIPPIILVLQGNGPGEPLEGQPVSAVSIIIRGVSGMEGNGSFDGSQMELAGLAFRIQVVVGEISIEDIAALSPLVDFKIEDLTLVTEEPYTDGHISLLIDTTLSKTPSGNPIFDEFLGGAQILVRFKGNLEF